ncbi:MAG: flagellar basal body-associated FliL family protein [Desulfobulbaceae bacterium]|nr:flagellar basal body-associated FliL family protein [Desulfobulbaceae bacterium]
MAAEDAKAEGTEGKPKKKGMLLIIIGVLVVVMGGGGFFAYTKFMAPKPVISEEEQIKKEPEEKEGEVFALDPFLVNLSDPKGKRYLKVTVSLELPSPEAKAKAEKMVPKMRDMVIMMLTSLSFEEVMTPEGKIRIREELYERFNLIMRPERVKGIFFTDFVVQ